MSQHIATVRSYLGIFAALIGLTLLTVGIAYVDLGAWNTLVAVTIAVCKGTLVLLFFMHLIHSSRLTWIYAAAGFVWLAILVAFTLSDTLTRGWLPLPGGLP
ncbi:MAG: cytochrome C oxidase subunit IV family protein [Verrucomicrobia bacterium]|nr:cytochrome C oxidase subunit IV family protein [Verrucomicrobiota bacterium]